MYWPRYSYAFPLARWLVVIALAMALALAFATTVHGQEAATPRLLPNDAISTAKPMPTTDANDYQKALKLWQVLGYFDEGRYDLAATELTTFQLTEESESWRLTALGYAYLKTEKLDKAIAVLDRALEADAGNAVAHYVKAETRLAQAKAARLWTVPKMDTQFVVYVPPTVSPNTPAMFQMAAHAEFHAAIGNSTLVDAARHLLDSEWVTPPEGSGHMPLETPHVGDLLDALELTKYVGNSHLALAKLDLQRGSLDASLDELNKATEAGLKTGDWYRKLGAAFERQEDYPAARRAYLEAMAHGGGTLIPFSRILNSLGKPVLR